MTERDGAWMARIIARFTRPEVEAIVAGARFTNPLDAAYIVDVLMARRQRDPRALPDPAVAAGRRRRAADGRICAIDLRAPRRRVPRRPFRYEIIRSAVTHGSTLAAT